jgi:hypothetical protein
VSSKSNQYTEDIERFIDFFSRQLEVIKIAQFTDKGSLYKKVLLVSFFDALSKTVYPRKGNRDRFVSFIRYFGKWKDCERISLPHLVRLLEKVPDTDFSELRKFALSHFTTWVKGEVIYLDRDPAWSEVQNLWPKEKEYAKPLENLQLDSLRHVHLLYSYRNSLIHEMRKPGYGMEFTESEAPFYMSMVNEDNKSTWELAYPLNFFLSVSERILTGLGAYYTENSINPYDYYGFGTYWVEDLNR